MTTELPLSLDTNVVSISISLGNELSPRYGQLLQSNRLALTYFALAELESANWSVEKTRRLNKLVDQCILLNNPTEVTRLWFARAVQVRARLDLERGAEREDLWLIAQTAEYGLPLLSHDYNAVRVASGLGLDCSRTLLNPQRLARFVAEDARLLEKGAPS